MNKKHLLSALVPIVVLASLAVDLAVESGPAKRVADQYCTTVYAGPYWTTVCTPPT